MKKIILLALIAMTALAACVNDKGNYDYTELPPVVIEGIEPLYEQTVGTRLTITPTLEREDDYDYCWFVYPEGNRLAEADTLSTRMVLDVDINLSVGNYLMVFNARNKATGITEIITTKLVMEMENSKGWYFTKEIDGHVDIDIFFEGGEARNWISGSNEGYRPIGNAKKTMLLNNYEEFADDGFTTRVLLVATDQDLAIVKVNGGQVTRSWDTDLFYSAPAVRNVQSLFTDSNHLIIGAVINGQIYQMTMGVNSGGGPMVARYLGSTIVNSGVAASGYAPIMFDSADKSLMKYEAGKYSKFNEKADTPSSNNMNADPVWEESYFSPRDRTCMLMKSVGTGDYTLVTINSGFSGLFEYIAYGANPIVKTFALAPGSRMISASARGGYFGGSIIFLGEGNNLYRYTFDESTGSQNEGAAPLWTLSAGEEITDIQHIRYATSGVNKLAVASYDGSNYRVYLFDFAEGDATGNIDFSNAVAAYQGEGVVKCINWLDTPAASPIPDGSITHW